MTLRRHPVAALGGPDTGGTGVTYEVIHGLPERQSNPRKRQWK
jgi:hypothetical protein